MAKMLTLPQHNPAAKVHSILRFISLASFIYATAACAQPAPEVPATVTGIVQDMRAEALQGSTVTLESSPDGTRYEAQAGQEGVFRFAGVRSGRYLLTIKAHGFYPAAARLDLRPGEQKSLTPVRVPVGAAGCFLPNLEPDASRFLVDPSLGGMAGRVRGGSSPVNGARITLACWDASRCTSRAITSGPEGAFSFDSVRPGRYVLQVQQNGYYPLKQEYSIAGGLESSYSLSLDSCPNGNCAAGQAFANPSPVVCE